MQTDQLNADRRQSIEVALVEAARALSSRLDVNGVAAALLQAVDDVFGAASSWVLLLDPLGRRLRTVASRGPQAHAFRDVAMPTDGGIMGLAFSSRKMVFVPDAQADDRWFDMARVYQTDLRSVLVVPLIAQDRAIGVVGLDAPQFGVGNPPAAGDVARLEALAAQAAVAIANAQLYEASERDRRRLTALLNERRGLRRRMASLEEDVRAAYTLPELVGESAIWKETVRLADVVAAADTTVLLLGETGTGKELLARRIHEQSGRAAGPFVAVNCAALPDALVESDLFGHEKGAFTNAVARKLGKFELADGGTLFLDEVGELPGEAQAKLLRVLQDSKVERVGGTTPVSVDIRLIAATNTDLESALAGKSFRSDLYFRLSVFPVTLPALRERRSDVPLLARHFARMFARKLARPASEVSDQAVQRLLAYAWPGNVRELQNVMERAAILSTTTVVQPDAIWLPRRRLGPALETRPAAVTTLAEADRRAILAALEACRWRISGAGGAAEKLGAKPTTLHAKMKKLGIRRPANAAPRP
jgi:formate hydrogenlyase transcriptional activator